MRLAHLLTGDPSIAEDLAQDAFERVRQDGFEGRLADRVSSTDRPLEAVSVGGHPATLGAYDDTDWWVLLQPEPGRALELRIAGDRTAVDQILSRARFVDEGTWDSVTGPP